MNCRICQGKLHEMLVNKGDPFGFYVKDKLMWCENKECELFGMVTVAGVMEDTNEVAEEENK